MRAVSRLLLGASLGASWLLAGCAGTRSVQTGPVSAAHLESHGSILARGPATKAIVAGPAVVHAYATETGGDLFAAPAITGSDRDCVWHREDTRVPTRIVTNRRVVLRVESGQIACLVTSNPRNLEVLWHAQRDGRAGNGEPQLAIARTVR